MAESPKEHMLVVNERAVILEVFRELFENEGHSVTVNKFVRLDSKETLLDIEELHPDVIVLDFLKGKNRLAGSCCSCCG